MDEFKVPQNIPQDLLLIQEFIDVPNPTPNPQQDDDIDSSGSDSETVSEDEIAADLIKGTDEDNSTQVIEKTFGFLPSYITSHLLKSRHLLVQSLATPALKPTHYQTKTRPQSQKILLIITIYKIRTMMKTLCQTLLRELIFKQNTK